MSQENFEQLGMFPKDLEPAIPVDTNQLGWFQRGSSPKSSPFKTQTTESDDSLAANMDRVASLPDGVTTASLTRPAWI